MSVLLAIALLVVGFVGVSSADTIVMEDGKEVKGIIVEDYKDRVVFSTPDGEMIVKKADIRELSLDSDDDSMVRLAEQAVDRRDYSKAMSFYEKALKANPNSASAKQGIVFLRGLIMRNQESRKAADIKRQQDIELYGGARARRTETDEISDMAQTLTKSTGITIVIKDNAPEIESVKPDSPAFEAGVRKGDLLVSVWGKLTGYLSRKEVLDLLLNKSAIEIKCVIERAINIAINPKRLPISGSEDLIGASFTMEPDGLTVSAVREGGSAIEAGLQKGDLVTAIDGKQTRYMRLKKAIEIIRNSKQGSVKLTIRRNTIIWRGKEL